MIAPDFVWRTIDWNLVRVFHEIVERGGVSAAARSLGRQQPAVSQALSRLEERLGVSLCQRGPQGFALTPEGEIVYNIAHEIVLLMRDAPGLLAQASGEIRGQLRIWSMSAVSSHELDEILGTICRRYPLLEVTIELAAWESVLKAVRSGDADIGLSYTQVVDADLAHEPAFSEAQQLYCSPRHRLFGQVIDRPSDLSDEVFFLTGRDEPVELTNFRRQYSLGTKSRGGSEDLNELKRLILTGAAVGFLPMQVAGAEERSLKLWPLLPPEILPSYPVYFVALPESQRSLAAQLFMNEVRRQQSSLAPAQALTKSMSNI